jgi:hypothetical protein
VAAGEICFVISGGLLLGDACILDLTSRPCGEPPEIERKVASQTYTINQWILSRIGMNSPDEPKEVPCGWAAKPSGPAP